MSLHLQGPSSVVLSTTYAAANRRRDRPGSPVMRPASQEPTVMASPPTVTFNDVSKIARTVTDAAITTGTATLTSATAAFTAGDKGRKVTVTGAGAAGAVLSTYISAVTNGTTVTLGANAGTTVSAASSTIGVKKTWQLSPPVAPSSQAGPAIMSGALTFGRIPSGNGSYALLTSAAAVGDTSILIGEKLPGPTGKIATGAYRIEPITPIPADATAADHLSGEDITITAVNGASAPYTATLSAPLTKAHRSGFQVATAAVSDGYNITSGVSFVGIWNGVGGSPIVETITDAPSVEFLVKAANSANTYRLWVDGQLVTATQQTAAFGGAGQPAANAFGYMLLQFGTRQTRRIRYEATTMMPAAIVSDACDSVMAPEDHSTRVLWVGDSFLAASAAVDGIAQQASRLMGWDCVMVDQIGGTGYVATNGGSNSAAPSRVASHIAAKPDVVVIALGLNDTTATGLQTVVQNYLTALRAGLPNARIYVVGPWSNGDTTNTAKAGIAAAIRDAAAGAGATHIDTMLGVGPKMNPWVVGTGKTGAPAFNGNADIVVDTDGTHPTRQKDVGNVSGERYYADRIAAGIAQALPA